MNEPKSFEVTEYSKGAIDPRKKLSAVYQIAQDKERDSPTFGVRVALAGNLLRVYYQAYEMCAPVRMREIESAARESLNEFVKYLKKEFKSKMKQALSLKEQKEKADYTIQKTSLNERYMCTFWRFYELD